MPDPHNGRTFRIQRLALGLSLRALATELRQSPSTLARWEHDPRPLAPDRREEWADAIAACAVRRAVEMQSAGASLDDLRATDVGTLALSWAPRLFPQ